MPLSTDRLAQIAFKNLLGKSQVQKNFGVGQESFGYLFNVPSTNVWSSKIADNDPTTAVSNQIAVQIVADLVNIPDSASDGQFLSYRAKWPSTLQILGANIDPKTNKAYQYGVGSLLGITSGTNILDFIPDSYGLNYGVKVYTSYPSAQISPGDPREWLFQYSSGIFYQDIVTSSGYQAPTKIVGYFYIGNKLSTLDQSGAEIIRVSATGPDTNQEYKSLTTTPPIFNYSINHLYLVDFTSGNTSPVKLNIDNVGTYSIYKYGISGLSELSSGDIVGGVGLTAGPLYYLTWSDDNYFLFFESNPSQTPGLFKNENRTLNTVGGIELGTSFNDVQFQDMFSDLLYPENLGNFSTLDFTHPNISSTSNTQFKFIDIGRNLTGTLTFSWTFQNPSDFLTSSIFVSDLTPVTTSTNNWPPPSRSLVNYNSTNTSGTFSYTYSVFSNIPDKRIFAVTGTRKNNTLIRKYGEISWTWRAYFGSSTNSTLTPSGVTSLSSQLMTNSVGTFNISGTQGFKYLAFPNLTSYDFKSITHLGLPVALATSSYTSIDQFGNNFATISITNSFGRNITYKIYRTLNQINGTLSVNITN